MIESGPLLSTSDILPWVCTQALLLSGETGIKGSSSHSLQGEREAGTEELAIVHTHTLMPATLSFPNLSLRR